MRRLTDTGRASMKDPQVASTVGFICYMLDDNTFRYMMSFLLTSDKSKTTDDCEKVMFDDIDDNWSTDFEDKIGKFMFQKDFLFRLYSPMM